MEHRQKNYEESDIRNFKDPEEDFVSRHDTTIAGRIVASRTTSGLLKSFNCADDATDQDHGTGDVEDVEDRSMTSWEVLGLAATIFEECHQGEEECFDKALQDKRCFEASQPSCSL